MTEHFDDVSDGGVTSASSSRQYSRARATNRSRSNGSPPENTHADAPGDPESVARTICLQQLSVRARSRAELASILRRRGIPDEAVAVVLDRFTQVGLIDDGDYATAVVRSQHSGMGRSRRAVALELRRRGVSDEDAEPALQQIDEASELAAARQLAAKKLRALAGLDQDTVRRRLYGVLGRRGYGAELSTKVVRELTGAPAAESA